MSKALIRPPITADDVLGKARAFAPVGALLSFGVADPQSPVVTLKSRIGGALIVDMFTGEQLPRIY
jgi:hypothetical protein